MKNTLLAGTALALVATAGAANAADLAPVYKAAPVVVAPSWTGFYIGGNLGAASTTGDLFVEAHGVAFPFGTTSTFPIRKTGLLAGGQVGYNWQTGMTVVGLEADAAWTDLKTSHNTVADPFFFNKGNARFTSDINWLATVRGRVGIAATPGLLLYVTGGGAAAGANVRYQGTGGFPAAFVLGAPLITNFSAGKTIYGWTAGFGAEYALSSNWSIKAEYLRVTLSDATLSVPLQPGLAGLLGSVSAHQDIDLIRAGVNYRF